MYGKRQRSVFGSWLGKLGVYNEGSGIMKGAWWWSEEVKGKVEEKQEKYKALVGSRTDEEREINRIQYRMRTRRLREQWQ